MHGRGRLRARTLGAVMATAIGATALPGCSADAPTPAAAALDGSRWHRADVDRGVRPYGEPIRELAVLSLPWAGNAGADVAPAGPYPRLIVNLEATRSLYVKGKRWSMAEERRAEALEALGAEASHWFARAPRTEGTPGALLRADYRTPFGDVRGALSVLRSPRVGIEHLAFGAAGAGADPWMDSRIEVTPSARSEGTGTPLSLDLSPVEGGPASGRAVRLRISGDARTNARLFDFPMGDPYGDAEAIAAANVLWRGVVDELRASRGRDVTSVALSIDDRVPWAHAAMTLGLLLEAGLADAELSGFGRLHLTTPPTIGRRDDAPDDARDGVAVIWILAGAAGASGLFVLMTREGARRRRGRPPAVRAGADAGPDAKVR